MLMADWYCKIGGKLYGPFDHARLRLMADEARLLPDDLLREGEDGDWFPAEEIENLFPAPAGGELRDEDNRRRRKKRKTVNYYGVMMQNLQEGGAWTNYIGWTAVFEGLLRGITVAVVAIREFNFDALTTFVVWTIVGAVMLLAYCLVDVLLFGVPCVLLGVRLEPRRHHILDLFGYAYVLGLAVVLFRTLTSCGSMIIADFLLLLVPVVHAIVFGYIMQNYWDLPAGKAWALAGIRFAYQMLFIGAYLCVRYFAD
jgi:hypothetical protein